MGPCVAEAGPKQDRARALLCTAASEGWWAASPTESFAQFSLAQQLRKGKRQCCDKAENVASEVLKCFSSSQLYHDATIFRHRSAHELQIIFI